MILFASVAIFDDEAMIASMIRIIKAKNLNDAVELMKIELEKNSQFYSKIVKLDFLEDKQNGVLIVEDENGYRIYFNSELQFGVPKLTMN